jgi:hypothetical protein
MKSQSAGLLISSLLFGIVLGGVGVRADDVIFSAPGSGDVRKRTLEWVATKKVADTRSLDEIGQLWADVHKAITPADMLQKVVGSFALADPETKRFIDKCDPLNPPRIPPDFRTVTEPEANKFYIANLGLFVGHYLAQAKMYDEALEVLSNLDVTQTVDPSTCLFFTAVCQHQLLIKEDGLESIQKLLEQTQDVPIRYRSVAALMQYDLERVADKSLDEVAHMMSDVERRLGLGRGGRVVQKREAEIVSRLDEIIKRLEEQQGGGGGGGGAGGNSNNPTGAANDSSVKGSTGEGKADKKKEGSDGAWGKLDEKDEARAKQLIGRDFPPHYRRAVEQYFRKLAKQRASRGK